PLQQRQTRRSQTHSRLPGPRVAGTECACISSASRFQQERKVVFEWTLIEVNGHARPSLKWHRRLARVVVYSRPRMVLHSKQQERKRSSPHSLKHAPNFRMVSYTVCPCG